MGKNILIKFYVEESNNCEPMDLINNVIVELTGLKFIIFEMMKDGLQENRDNMNCMSESLQTSIEVCVQQLKYAREQLKGKKRND